MVWKCDPCYCGTYSVGNVLRGQVGSAHRSWCGAILKTDMLKCQLNNSTCYPMDCFRNQLCGGCAIGYMKGEVAELHGGHTSCCGSGHFREVLIRRGTVSFKVGKYVGD